MCMFNNKETRVKPSNTTLLGGRFFWGNQRLTHYLGYFNTVDVLTSPSQERSFGYRIDTPPPPLALGNAMLIPVPVAQAASGKLADRNIKLIPMGRHNGFINEYVQALRLEDQARQSRSMSKSFGPTLGGEAKVFKGFDDGLYDVVMTESAGLIESVIDQVDARKRPVTNSELYAKLDKLYPGWVWLLFCFSQEDTGKAGGALITYTSKYPDLIILPGLDGHSGEVETGDVEVDHTIIIGSNNIRAASVELNGYYADWAAKEAHWLPKRVIGDKFRGTMPQGDFLFLADEVEAGIFNCLRDLPPGWPKVYGQDSLPAPQYFADSTGRWNNPVRK